MGGSASIDAPSNGVEGTERLSGGSATSKGYVSAFWMPSSLRDKAMCSLVACPLMAALWALGPDQFTARSSSAMSKKAATNGDGLRSRRHTRCTCVAMSLSTTGT